MRVPVRRVAPGDDSGADNKLFYCSLRHTAMSSVSLQSIENWLIANSGTMLAAAGVDGYLIGGSWMEMLAVGLANAWWQQWYQANQPNSTAPYLTLVNPIGAIAIPTAAMSLFMGASLPRAAMVSMAGYIGFTAQSQITIDMQQVKTDVAP